MFRKVRKQFRQSPVYTSIMGVMIAFVVLISSLMLAGGTLNFHDAVRSHDVIKGFVLDGTRITLTVGPANPPIRQLPEWARPKPTSFTPALDTTALEPGLGIFEVDDNYFGLMRTHNAAFRNAEIRWDNGDKADFQWRDMKFVKRERNLSTVAFFNTPWMKSMRHITVATPKTVGMFKLPDSVRGKFSVITILRSSCPNAYGEPRLRLTGYKGTVDGYVWQVGFTPSPAPADRPECK